MDKDNIVVFKGKKDSILILLDDNVDFDELKEGLREKARDASRFFGGAKSAINFSGRHLTEAEEDELITIVKEQANLNVSYIGSVDDTHTGGSGGNAPKPKPTMDFSPHENTTTFHQGSLRSGQSIRYPGSVVVIGDVKPGAEIVAEGNIIVFGTVKGLVHAGCTGNTECFVAALNLSPTQLRMADIATYIPEDMLKKNAKKPKPAYAYIQGGRICVAPME